MGNDNVYQPRGGYLPTEPTAQVQERDEEITRTLSVLPRLREAVEHLDERIAFYGSVDSVDDSVLLDANKFMNVIAGNKVAKANLEIERDWFIGLIQDASKE